MHGFCVKESPKWAIQYAFANLDIATPGYSWDNLFFAKALGSFFSFSASPASLWRDVGNHQNLGIKLLSLRGCEVCGKSQIARPLTSKTFWVIMMTVPKRFGNTSVFITF